MDLGKPSVEVSPAPPPGKSFRRWVRALHRNVGYLFAGVTLLYVISGIAVNHRHDWNPDAIARSSQTQIGTPCQLLAELAPPQSLAHENSTAPVPREYQEKLSQRIAQILNLPRPTNAIFRGPRRFSVFFGRGDTSVVDYDPISGIAVHRTQVPRWLLAPLNSLHRNEPGGAWTYFADAYAIGLASLVLTGMATGRGRKGLVGLGGLLLFIGLIAPVLAWIGVG